MTNIASKPNNITEHLFAFNKGIDSSRGDSGGPLMQSYGQMIDII
jgi:hypothetical protein